MTCRPSRSTAAGAGPSTRCPHAGGRGRRRPRRERPREGTPGGAAPHPQPFVGRHAGDELDAERLRHGGPSLSGRVGPRLVHPGVAAGPRDGRRGLCRDARARRLPESPARARWRSRDALGLTHAHAEAADHEAPDGREEARRPAVRDPGRLPEGVVSRTELNALQADPPEWLSTLRRNGPHTRQETARRLGISNSGLARGGVGEHLTTEQIKAVPRRCRPGSWPNATSTRRSAPTRPGSRHATPSAPEPRCTSGRACSR